jgi:hypothetical protein
MEIFESGFQFSWKSSSSSVSRFPGRRSKNINCFMVFGAGFRAGLWGQNNHMETSRHSSFVNYIFGRSFSGFLGLGSRAGQGNDRKANVSQFLKGLTTEKQAFHGFWKPETRNRECFMFSHAEKSSNTSVSLFPGWRSKHIDCFMVFGAGFTAVFLGRKHQTETTTHLRIVNEIFGRWFSGVLGLGSRAGHKTSGKRLFHGF